MFNFSKTVAVSATYCILILDVRWKHVLSSFYVVLLILTICGKRAYYFSKYQQKSNHELGEKVPKQTGLHGLPFLHLMYVSPEAINRIK